MAVRAIRRQGIDVGNGEMRRTKTPRITVKARLMVSTRLTGKNARAGARHLLKADIHSLLRMIFVAINYGKGNNCLRKPDSASRMIPTAPGRSNDNIRLRLIVVVYGHSGSPLIHSSWAVQALMASNRP